MLRNIMFIKIITLITTAFALLLGGNVYAQERGTKEEVVAMVDRAIAHHKKAGSAQALKDFSDKGNAEWHVKDVYLFCYDFKAVNTCHGANEKLIGKDLSELKTPDGQFLIKNMVKIVSEKDAGWIEYEWPHPQTKKVEHKQAYVKRIPGTETFLGSGIYR